MGILTKIAEKLPSVIKPVQKLTLRDKFKWTLIILLIYFVMGSILVAGIDPDAVVQIGLFETIFGSTMGSLITLGIGPIVTASIILQLLVGSKLIPWDLRSEEGKAKFSGTQKILAITFCFVEAVAFVLAGAIPPADPGIMTVTFVILQLTAGGIIILFMDEVCSKWGIGSGISLFIAAGVAKTIFIRALNPLATTGAFPIPGETSAGLIPGSIYSLAAGQVLPAIMSLLPLIATLVVFVIVVYAQNIRVEIPMSFILPFGKIAARRWPLKFFYTSNIPVILIAAVLANVSVMAKFLYDKGINILGIFDAQGNPIGGFVYYVTSPSSPSLLIITVLGGVLALAFAFLTMKTWKKNVIKMSILGGVIGLVIGFILTSTFGPAVVTVYDILRSMTYISIMIIGSVVFSMFWTLTSGMDAASVAEQFKESSIMIPGFRRDPRIIEKILKRYIPALTVMGGAFVGFLAGFADLTSALGTGTGILLTVMIVFQLYEQIVSQHYDELPEFVKKMMGEK